MWEDFELDAERIPVFKLILHSAQILLAFTLFCLEIAVFRADGAAIVGNNIWTFAAVFLTVPAWIFLVMAPRFPRTRKLAEPHAMVVVDSLFTVVWLSGFATQAAYNTAGLCGTACGLSKAVVGLGFFIFLFFAMTTFLSIWTLKYYEWNNRLPGYDRAQLGSQNIDPDKAAFSLAPHDEEAYAPVNMADHDDHHDDHHDAPHFGGARSDYSDPYSGSHAGGSTAGGYTDNPFRRQDASPFESDTEYHSGSVSTAGGRHAAAGAPAADPFVDDSRPARFPSANYDRIER